MPAGHYFASDSTDESKFDGMTITGLKVFRSGTFRDSMGDQNTWESHHLAQMVFNFDHLREQGIFPNVPVKEGHYGGISGLAGYFDRLYVEGDFLLADFTFTDPSKFEKWQNGTYRARSIEIGMYETNAEAFFWPTVMGVAFVERPAVEGLYEKNEAHEIKFFSQMESPMPASPPAAPTVPAPAVPPVVEHSAPPAVEPPTVPPPALASPAPALHTFMVAGQPTQDFAAVQAHVAALESFQAETVAAARVEFVNSLVASNKVAAPQAESMRAFAASLSAEHFDAWKATYAAAPVMPLFGSFGVPTTNHDGSGSDPALERISILEDTIKMHEGAGKSQEFIKSTKSYKELEILRAKRS